MGYGDQSIAFLQFANTNGHLPQINDLEEPLHDFLLPQRALINSHPFDGNGTLVATHYDGSSHVQYFHRHPSAGDPDSVVVGLQRARNSVLQGSIWFEDSRHPIPHRLTQIGDRGEMAQLTLQGDRFGGIRAYLGRRGGQVRVGATEAPLSLVNLDERIKALLDDTRIHQAWKDLIHRTHADQLPSLLGQLAPDRWHRPPPHNVLSPLNRRGSASLGSLLALVGVCVAAYGVYEISQHSESISDFGNRLIASAKESFNNMSWFEAALMFL